MSNYHIMGGLADGNSYTVAFHLPVTSASNLVGVNYRTALIQSLGGSQASSVPWIDAGEQAQLAAGELYEFSYRYATNPSDTLLDKRAYLDTLFSALSTVVMGQIETRFAYWGYDRDVP